MSHSYINVYVHLVWKTKFSKALLRGDLEQFVHSNIRQLGKELGLTVLAVNSAWNHVHSLYGWHPRVCIDSAAQMLKGRTSHDWNARLDAGLENGPRLKWQVGYGAVSIRQSEITAVVNYIERQKHHHTIRDLLLDPETVHRPPTDPTFANHGGARL